MDPSSRTPASAGFAITIDEPAWRRYLPRALPRRLARALAAFAPISVVLSSDRAVRRLNARDRGRDKPTNVLTYEPPAQGLPGELVLAFETVRREAVAAHRRVADHMAHLVVHGALHLAGLDHARAGDARRMEMAEARLLARIGVGNPWRPGRAL